MEASARVATRTRPRPPRPSEAASRGATPRPKGALLPPPSCTAAVRRCTGAAPCSAACLRPQVEELEAGEEEDGWEGDAAVEREAEEEAAAAALGARINAEFMAEAEADVTDAD